MTSNKPNVILGIDLSTTRTGVSIIDKKENLILSDLIRFDSSVSLEIRASYLEGYFTSLGEIYNFEKVFLEEPFVAIGGGGGSAFTTSIVHTFSGMCRYILFKTLKKEATMVNVRSVRSKLGMRFPRGLKGREVKQIVIDFVKSVYSDSFEYELTHKGNYKPGTDDRADAIVVGLGGFRFFS